MFSTEIGEEWIIKVEIKSNPVLAFKQKDCTNSKMGSIREWTKILFFMILLKPVCSLL